MLANHLANIHYLLAAYVINICRGWIFLCSSLISPYLSRVNSGMNTEMSNPYLWWQSWLTVGLMLASAGQQWAGILPTLNVDLVMGLGAGSGANVG